MFGRQGWRRWVWMWLAAQGLSGAAAFAQEPVKYTEDWWAWRAQDPPGTRQVEHHGKLWPPFPRPTGEPQTNVHKYHHAHYWPYPYNCMDEAYVRQVIDLQTGNGWTSATTLLDYHFNEETHELNSAGKHQLHWILTHAPAQFRTVYVAEGMSPQIAHMRLAHVQDAAKEFSLEAVTPIVMRPVLTRGRPAEEIDSLRRLELQSMPRPRLFTVGSATRGGTGGAAAGGGSGSQSAGSGSGSGGGSSTR
jgi:uncharacterized membrane protein YgcG